MPHSCTNRRLRLEQRLSSCAWNSRSVSSNPSWDNYTQQFPWTERMCPLLPIVVLPIHEIIKNSSSQKPMLKVQKYLISLKYLVYYIGLLIQPEHVKIVFKKEEEEVLLLKLNYLLKENLGWLFLVCFSSKAWQTELELEAQFEFDSNNTINQLRQWPIDPTREYDSVCKREPLPGHLVKIVDHRGRSRRRRRSSFVVSFWPRDDSLSPGFFLLPPIAFLPL